MWDVYRNPELLRVKLVTFQLHRLICSEGLENSGPWPSGDQFPFRGDQNHWPARAENHFLSDTAVQNRETHSMKSIQRTSKSSEVGIRGFNAPEIKLHFILLYLHNTCESVV